MNAQKNSRGKASGPSSPLFCIVVSSAGAAPGATGEPLPEEILPSIEEAGHPLQGSPARRGRVIDPLASRHCAGVDRLACALGTRCGNPPQGLTHQPPDLSVTPPAGRSDGRAEMRRKTVSTSVSVGRLK